MTEEFLESEILFSDSDSEQNFLNADHDDLRNQNRVRFYYNHADENRRQSYKSSKMEESDEKPKGTAPIEIPNPNNRSTTHKRLEFEDWEYLMLPPHEIVARRFADKLIPFSSNIQP